MADVAVQVPAHHAMVGRFVGGSTHQEVDANYRTFLGTQPEGPC